MSVGGRMQAGEDGLPIVLARLACARLLLLGAGLRSPRIRRYNRSARRPTKGLSAARIDASVRREARCRAIGLRVAAKRRTRVAFTAVAARVGLVHPAEARAVGAAGDRGVTRQSQVAAARGGHLRVGGRSRSQDHGRHVSDATSEKTPFHHRAAIHTVFRSAPIREIIISGNHPASYPRTGGKSHRVGPPHTSGVQRIV